MKIKLHGSIAQRVPKVLNVIHYAGLLSGICFLGWPIFVAVESSYAQWSGEKQLANQRVKAATSARTETIVQHKPWAEANAKLIKTGSVLGKFEVPRLKLSYIVLEGTDSRTLDKSIGHVEGTALIGEQGNIGIAGHRNTHFRKLEWIRRGDEISLTAEGVTHRYAVEWVRLFAPEDVEVLDPSHGPAVTLVTCFPFEYVGSAPLRMIVRALPLPESNSQAATKSGDSSQ